MSRVGRGRRRSAGARDRRRILAVTAVVSAAIALGASAVPTFQDLERSAYDLGLELRGDDPARLGPVPVALVAIDDRTLGDRRLADFPFSRTYHARVLDRLREAGARTIAYDVEFSGESRPGPDSALVEAVARAPRVVLAASETADDGTTGVLGGVELQREIGVRVGHSRMDVDPDGVLRRVAASHARLRTFSVVAAERATGRPVDRSTFDGEGDALIDWVGGAGSVPTLSFVDVLDGRVPADRLRGRIVVVGATAPVLKDVLVTPMDDGRQLAGPEIQAQAIATLLRGAPLREAWWPLGVLLTALAAAVPALAGRRGRSFSTLVVAGAGVAGILLVAWLAFTADRVLPVAQPLLALGLGTLGAVAAGAAFEAVERQRTREIFSRFVSTDVVDDVLARTDDEVRLGGVRVDTTILFCDLRGSTALLEGLEPERGIAVLNRFLGAMSDSVDAHGGTLVGYRGDGLMAVFGAPLEQTDHADRAVACAREMAGPALGRCHAALRADGVTQELRMGVGVASGPVMAGNVGSERRMEYTAIGDAANVAARLEGLTKDHGRAVLVAGGTVERLSSTAGLDPLGPIPVRGRLGTVEVWAAD